MIYLSDIECERSANQIYVVGESGDRESSNRIDVSREMNLSNFSAFPIIVSRSKKVLIEYF